MDVVALVAEEENDRPGDGVVDRAIGVLERRWDALVVAALGVFMFLARMRPYDRYNTDNGSFFIGTDAYYHARHVLFSVRNFPQTLTYDPWTQYPIGTDAGPFGTLFDQGAAALVWLWSLVQGAGTPSTAAVVDVLTMYPALLGALTIIPVFLLARDLFGKKPAVFAAVGLALIPGSFLRRSIAGWPDHHSVEALLSTLALLGAYRAYTAWDDSGPWLDKLLEDPSRLWTLHRRALAASLLGALGFFVYMAAWPSGILFVGIAGLWLLVQTMIDVSRERDAGPVVATTVTMFGFTGVLMIPFALSTPGAGFSALNYTWLQPVFPLLLAGAGVLLGWMAQTWEDRSLPRQAYPAAVVGAGLASMGLVWVVLPGLLSQVVSGASWVFDSTLGWVPGMGVRRARLTISEAQPIDATILPQQFGWLLYTALIGFVIGLIDLAREGKAPDTLLSIWAFVAVSGAFTQSRFLYYLAIAVILLNAKFARRLFDGAQAMSDTEDDAGKGRTSGDRISPSTGRAIVVVVLALALLPVNVLGFTASCREGQPNAWTQADCFAPDREGRDWTQGTDWLRENSPQGPISLTTQYDHPPRGERFDYPEGAYGVLSWWDYGHIIEWNGRRPPVANPFQQQAPLASEIFTSPNEADARSLLLDYLGEDDDVRYLMIDDAMVSGKFGAITVWAGEQQTYRQGASETFDAPRQAEQDEIQLPTVGDAIRSMFLQDVYANDADGMEHFRLVHENDRYAWIGNQGRTTEDGFRLERYNRVLGVGSADRARSSFGNLSFESGDQLIPIGQQKFAYDLHVESVLKTYEHVAGATLTGSGEPGEEVHVKIPLQVESVQRTFTYTQTAAVGPDGSFSVTVPYSTTAYVPASEGGTNTDVVAQGPAEVTVGNRSTTVSIPDAAVLDGRTLPVGLPG